MPGPTAAEFDGRQTEDPAAILAVVLNYNRPKLTIRCVTSLIQQKGVRLELVVVDNWSNGEQLRELRGGLPPGVRLIENSSNLGYSAGNNTGLRLSDPGFDFALVLNNDTTLNDPLAVSRLLGALRDDKTCAACSPLVRDADCGVSPERSIQVRRIPNFWELLIVSSAILRRLPWLRGINRRQIYADQRPYALNSVIACDTINGSCFLIRSAVLREIGYLDEGTFLYCEELILGFQVRLAGYHCALVTHSIVDHEQGASAGRNAAGATLRGMLRRMRSEIYFARTYLRAGIQGVLLLEIVGAVDILCKVTYGVFRRLGR